MEEMRVPVSIAIVNAEGYLLALDERKLWTATSRSRAKSNRDGRLKDQFPCFAQESFSVTVRLNTGAPGLESMRSATK